MELENMETIPTDPKRFLVAKEKAALKRQNNFQILLPNTAKEFRSERFPYHNQ